MSLRTLKLRDKNHLTPLLPACEHGQDAAIDFLIKRGANLNAEFLAVSSKAVRCIHIYFEGRLAGCLTCLTFLVKHFSVFEESQLWPLWWSAVS